MTLEGVLAAFYDGLRLATLLICFGAANVLANPKRLLKSMPSALHEIGVAVTVALDVAPQLVESAYACTAPGSSAARTRRLPHHPADRDSRPDRRARPLAPARRGDGLARLRAHPTRSTAARRRTSGLLVLGGLFGVCVGPYGLLDATAPAGARRCRRSPSGSRSRRSGMARGRERVRTTQYRPDPWSGPNGWWPRRRILVAVGDVRRRPGRPRRPQPVAATAALARAPAVLPTLGVLVGALPAWLAPRPPTAGRHGLIGSQFRVPAAEQRTPETVS